MALFNRTDMTYRGYQWTAYPNDNPRVTGNPDSTRFSRYEGYEVLYLINTLAIGWNLNKVSDCQKMEKMIHEVFPSWRERLAREHKQIRKVSKFVILKFALTTSRIYKTLKVTH